MVQNVYYHLIDAIVYLIAAAIPVYFILKSRKSIDNNNNLLRLTIVLVGFILLQVFYHIAGIAGFRLLAKGFVEPLSMAALLVFGIIYIFSIWNTKRQRQQQELKT
jgi:lipopolysaccharide export LptBFGC system permease protein LptF